MGGGQQVGMNKLKARTTGLFHLNKIYLFFLKEFLFQLRHANSQLQHVESHFLTRDQTQAPCIGSVDS